MSVVKLLLAFAWSLLVWSPTGSSAAYISRSPSAKVKNGTLNGVYSPGYKQDFFLGVPFAQPPVGDLRLRNPHSLNTTFKTKEAVHYSPLCVGYGSDQFGYEISEDCLTLNVIRPAGIKHNSKLPVAVWIHGGGYFMGGSGDRRYNLSFIVQNSVQMDKPIIGISINYRLAQWGFLAGEEVQKAGLANLGLKDQRLALNWIHENINAFGGDSKKVTIFGESAGGGSVTYQAELFGGRDDKLFRGVIAESIYINAAQNNKTFAETNFRNVSRVAGCSSASDQIACIRALPYDKLNAVFNETTYGKPNFGPVTDGDLLRDYNSNLLNSGRFVKSALLIGANTDEGSSFGQRGINTDAEFAAAVSSVGPDAKATAEILKLYPDDPAKGIPATLAGRPPPGSPLGSQWKRSAAFFGDQVMHAVRRQYNQQWTKRGVKNYSYRFNARPNGLPDSSGVGHFQEVAFVFDNTMNLGYGPPISAKPFENRGKAYTDLAKLMSRMWVSFVHDLDPNNHGIKGTARWPQYGDGSPKNFVFDVNVTSHTEPDTYRKEGIQFIIDNSVEQFDR